MRDDEKLADPKDVGPVARRFQYLLASRETKSVIASFEWCYG